MSCVGSELQVDEGAQIALQERRLQRIACERLAMVSFSTVTSLSRCTGVAGFEVEFFAFKSPQVIYNV